MGDLRVGLRLLWKDKAFTLATALTLAVCIGANAALFSVVEHVLLRSLPFRDGDRIVIMANHYPGAGVDIGQNSAAPDYFDRLRETSVFDEQAMYNSGDVSVDQNGTPTRIQAMYVTPSFFRLLQIAPRLGRMFSEDEGRIGNQLKVVISYGFWQTQFGGSPGAIGSDLRIDGQANTIVGVVPQEFTFLNDKVQLWRALAFTDRQKSVNARHGNNWRNIGRLKHGATISEAQAQIDALNAANLDRFPQFKQLLINARFHTSVQRLQDEVVRDVKPTLFLMWGGAIFVLLIGCVNVANLVLVRSRSRLKELATRLALGAARWQVARQLLTESVLLTMISAAAGLAVAYMALRVLGSLSIQELPLGYQIRIDQSVIVYSLAIAALIGLVLGAIPVASVLPANVTTILREEGRSSTVGRGARTLRRALVVAQVGFAFVLLVGAGLLFASFQRVLAIDPGFNAKGVLTASTELPRTRYKDNTALTTFVDDALREVRALPGIVAAGATDTIPFGSNHSDSLIFAEGYKMTPGESAISPNSVDVSPGYFEAIGAKIVRGRFFDDRDAATAPKVIIVDEKLAHRFWPGQDPIGRRMYRPDDINNLAAITDKTVLFTIVGVVHDIKLANLVESNSVVGAYFFPLSQDPARLVTFTLRTKGDPVGLSNSVRGVISAVDRELPVFDTQTMEERTERSLVTRRSPLVLSLTFGGVALFLSALGIYGVLAYVVTLRTREIGIRMALGSTAAEIFGLVLREGLGLVAAGFFLGAAGAFALRRSLESQLFDTSTADPLVLASVGSILAVVALVACVLPARRATRIDPVVALTT